MAPRDRQIRNNKRYLNSIAGQDRKKDFSDIFLQSFSLNEMAMIFAMLIILLLTVWSLSAVKKKSTLRKFVTLVAWVLILFVPIFAFKIYKEIITEEGVVLASLNARNGQGKNNSESFAIPEGRVISIILKNGNWSKVKVKSENKTLVG